MPAKHPTGALTLLNIKMKTLLQKSGSYVANTEGMDINMIYKDLMDAVPRNNISKQVKELCARDLTHTYIQRARHKLVLAVLVSFFSCDLSVPLSS